MNNGLIEEIIKSTTQTCPDFAYSNPLLDKNVARSLSKSFVSILRKTRCQNDKNGGRHSVLQSIRDICKSAPEGHIEEIDEGLTQLITSSYENQLKEQTSKTDIDKQLDAFLIKKSKTISPSSIFQSTVNPEVLQAMLNLDENVVFSEQISKDVLYWNIDDQKSKTILHNLWNEQKPDVKYFYDNASINMKSKIETILLNISHMLLVNGPSYHGGIFSEESDLKLLINACSISPECFQICIAILNTLFIETNFNTIIQKFIFQFIENVKFQTDDPISILYPVHLSNVATILDIALDEFPCALKQNYVQEAKNHLTRLQNSSENELIMLLSHFPLWLNIYFSG